MRLFFYLASLLGLFSLASAKARFAVYIDQWHQNVPTDKNLYKGITHVITAFASSSLFLPSSNEGYTPFLSPADIRARTDPGTLVCLAVGGWGDTAGFSEGCATEQSRNTYAQKLAQTLNDHGYDCVDIDWEYPGGNGDDYRQVPNSAKVSEIQNFPLFLQAIKTAIGTKQLSIAVPGREQDLIAYTTETGPILNNIVDHVHVMAYDLMNRRDNVTNHHESIVGAVAAVSRYLSRGFSPQKLSLGFAFYAKWFLLQSGAYCITPTGCPTALLENPDGTDPGRSGAVTFEPSNFPTAIGPLPLNLTITKNGTCGRGTYFQCDSQNCCSQYGSCGSTDEYCGTGCQEGYGKNCTKGGTRSDGAPDNILKDFATALANSKYDTIQGGRYYIDQAENLFWTWDNAGDIAAKYDRVYGDMGLGGVFVWSMGEDSYDWSRLKMLQAKVLEGNNEKRNKTVI